MNNIINNKIISILKNASNENFYLINNKYKIKFIKSGCLFNEYRHMKSCPTWETFEYATLIDEGKTIKVYIYEHMDINFFSASLCFEERGKIIQTNSIISIDIV